MSLVINNNMMAMNASRNMNKSYVALADSTRKLSSGLRIERAADDAAGLAIRELMKSDIAALNQGVRNANDAISLIQTADGALGIVDEKLIRMKELAEQAATGTYDSIQRAIIDSEYQQMASEITRIGNATDFNGIKLLDGSLSAADMNDPGASHDGSGGHGGGGAIGAAVTESVKVGAKKTLDTRHIAAFKFSADFEGNLKQHVGNGTGVNGTGFWVNDGVGKAREIKTVDELKTAMDAAIAGASDGSPPSTNILYGREDLAKGNTATRWDLTGWGGADPPSDLYVDVTAFGVLKMQATQRYLATEEERIASWGENSTVMSDAGGPFNAQGDLHGDFYLVDGTRITKLTDLDQAIKDGDSIYSVAGEINSEITGHSLEALKNNVAYDLNLFKETGEYNANIDPEYAVSLSDENGDLTQKYWVGPNDGPHNLLHTLDDLEAAIASGGNLFTDWGDVPGEAVLGVALDDLKAAASADAAAHAKVVAANAALDPDSVVTQSDADGNLLGEYFIVDSTSTPSIKLNTIEELKAALDAGTEIYKIEVWVGNVFGGGPAVITDDELAELTAAVDKDMLAHGGGPGGSGAGNNSTGPLKVHFGTGNNSAEDYYYIAIGDSRAEALGVGNNAFDDNGEPMAGHNVSTQGNAQESLDAITDAITSKDNIRAHLGSLQNRLENTISNISIQAENLQAAESRISDVDVANEMTNFIRNQVLTNAANAMLGQANQLPQMALKLLG